MFDFPPCRAVSGNCGGYKTPFPCFDDDGFDGTLFVLNYEPDGILRLSIIKTETVMRNDDDRRARLKGTAFG